MKRLTMRNSDGTVSQPFNTTVEDVFYRLAQYEDTGFAPEEIRNAMSDRRQFHDKSEYSYSTKKNPMDLGDLSGEKDMNYYEIYSKESGKLLARGTARECREKLGCSSIDTFYNLVSRTSRGLNGKYKVVIKAGWDTDYPVLGDKSPIIKTDSPIRCKDCEKWDESTGFCDENSYFIDDNGNPCSHFESDNWKAFEPDDYCCKAVKKKE